MLLLLIFSISRLIGNKACVLQIAPVCMTENIGTKNLTLFSMEKCYLPVKGIICSRILSVYRKATTGGPQSSSVPSITRLFHCHRHLCLTIVIDREAREIMHLVASVRLSVWVYPGHIIHHYNGIRVITSLRYLSVRL